MNEFEQQITILKARILDLLDGGEQLNQTIKSYDTILGTIIKDLGIVVEDGKQVKPNDIYDAIAKLNGIKEKPVGVQPEVGGSSLVGGD